MLYGILLLVKSVIQTLRAAAASGWSFLPLPPTAKSILTSSLSGI